MTLHVMAVGKQGTEVLLFHHSSAEEDAMSQTRYNLAINNLAPSTVSCPIGLTGLHVMHHAMEADKHVTEEPLFQHSLAEWLVVHRAMFNIVTTNLAQSTVPCQAGQIGHHVTGHAVEDPKHVTETF